MRTVLSITHALLPVEYHIKSVTILFTDDLTTFYPGFHVHRFPLFASQKSIKNFEEASWLFRLNIMIRRVVCCVVIVCILRHMLHVLCEAMCFGVSYPCA